MDLRQKENLLSKIIAGQKFVEIYGLVYIVKQPNSHDIYLANQIYERAKEKCLYGEIPFLRDIKLLTQTLNIWSDKDETRLTNLEKTVEDLKVRIYLERLNSKQVKTLTKNIDDSIVNISKFYERKQSLDYLSVESYSNMVRRQFLMCRSVEDLAGRKLLDFESSDMKTLEEIFTYLNHYNCDVDQLRELARGEPWRAYWDISKPTPFKSHFTEWTEDQKALVKFSKMYDNIYGHPECPPDDVIQNDYMLDGWIITLNREREAEKKVKENEKLVGKGIAQHTEQYIVVDKTPGWQNLTEHTPLSPEDKLNVVKNIEGMNEVNSRMIKEQRQKIIDKKGKVSETQLPDVRNRS